MKTILFDENNLPILRDYKLCCSVCGSNTIDLYASHNKILSSEAQIADNEDYGFAEMMENHEEVPYWSCLKTNCANCGQIYIINCESFDSIDFEELSERSQYDPSISPFDCTKTRYIPLNFMPHVNIMPAMEHLPSNIQELICQADALFWINPSSCVNILRSSIEKLLDNEGVQELNSRQKVMALGVRIESHIHSSNILHKYQVKLSAIRWLGNSGSHQGNMTHEDVYGGYKIFFHILDELFEEPERARKKREKTAEIESLSQKIESNKGPI